MFGWRHRRREGASAIHGNGRALACQCRSEEEKLAGTLADVLPGERVRICCLHGENRLIRRLSEMGFIPGTVIEVLRRAPFLDPIEFEIRGYLVSLRREEADCVRVKADAPVPPEISIDAA